jgi:hypothetical protein
MMNAKKDMNTSGYGKGVAPGTVNFRTNQSQKDDKND